MSTADPKRPLDDEDDDDEEDDDYVPAEGKSDDESEASDDVSDEGEVDDEPVAAGKRRRQQDAPASSSKVPKTVIVDEEEEKKRSDALWSSFADAEQKKAPVVTRAEQDPKVESPAAITTPVEPVTKEPTSVSTAPRPAVRRVGLADRLSALGKKKDSVLSKSKQDWERLKTEQGLAEELAEHTKSKESFVERQAFLQRADVRTFEQEKSVRDKIRARRFD